MTRRASWLLIPLLALTCSGCVTFVSATQDNPIDPAAVERLRPGEMKLPRVLELLGAPLEVHNQADGILLVYRYRARHTFRLGVSASQATRLVDATQVLSEALGNLSLTVQRIHAGEDRLVVLLDKAGVLQAAGVKRSTDDLPVF